MKPSRWCVAALCLLFIGTWVDTSVSKQIRPASAEEAERNLATIRQLIDALLKTDNIDEQERLVHDILTIDPAQPVAVQKLGEISARRKELAAQEADARKQDQQRREIQARKSEATSAATAAFARGISGGGLRELRAARAAADRALSIDKNDTEALRLTSQIDAAIRGRYIQLGALTLVILASITAATVVGIARYRSRNRVLRVVHGHQTGRTFAIPADKESVAIGTDPGAEGGVLVVDPTKRVSRVHCQLARSGKHYFVIDRSAHGTQINGRPIPAARPVLLRRGDEIRLAGEVTLRFN